MKASNLHEMWASPDNSRLTSKQLSFRLPVHVAAKIAALCEMYPAKNRTQIVADLLTSALDEVEKHLPGGLGDRVEGGVAEDIADQLGYPGETLYYLGGARGQFHRLANAHYQQLESELGNPSPDPLFVDTVVRESDYKKK